VIPEKGSIIDLDNFLSVRIPDCTSCTIVNYEISIILHFKVSTVVTWSVSCPHDLAVSAVDNHVTIALHDQMVNNSIWTGLIEVDCLNDVSESIFRFLQDKFFVALEPELIFSSKLVVNALIAPINDFCIILPDVVIILFW